jgi:two-component system response regulator AtoC
VAVAAPAPATDAQSLREQLDALERSVIARTMTAVGGNQSEAARRLGISRNTLTERLRRYQLAPEFGAGAVR